MADNFSVSILKEGLEDVKREFAEIARQQTLLTMRLSLACDKAETIAKGLANWNDDLQKQDPERRSVKVV